MYERILVATDGSQLSKKAVKNAIDLASATGSELVAMTVVPRYPMSYFEGAVGLAPSDIARTEKAWTEKALEVVDAIEEQARKRGVKARATVVHSDTIAESIMATARKHKCGLIVMASHGRKGLKRVLLGSETQHVLTHGNTPVLVLR
jgi:nucleotide-binding universal stress UspA family protein